MRVMTSSRSAVIAAEVLLVMAAMVLLLFYGIRGAPYIIICRITYGVPLEIAPLPFLDASGAVYFFAIWAKAASAPCWISSGVRSLIWVASIQV